MKNYIKSWAAVFFAAAILPIAIASCAFKGLGQKPIGPTAPGNDGDIITVRPAETFDILDNPGRGFAEFLGWERDIEDYPAPTVSYYRWSWAKLEPAEGAYDFALMDQCIAAAKAKGLGFAFRVMPHWNDDGQGGSTPVWLINKGVGRVEVSDGWFPDHNAPAFLEYHEKLVSAFGARYNGSPDLDHVDIGSVGCWGEWNTAAAPDPETVAVCEEYYPSTENQLKIIDCYLRAFPDTPLVIPLGAICLNETVRDYVIRNGIGWRGDSFGDGDDSFGDVTIDWNHTGYYDSLAGSANGPLKDIWKTAPVQFEVSAKMEDWTDKSGSHEDYDIDYVLDKGLEWHVSVLNAKSFPVPSAWRPSVDEFIKKMGYRLMLVSFSHAASAKRGGAIALDSEWKNVGVAPMYHLWPLAYRLRSADGTIAAQWVSEADTRTWLPAESHKASAEEVPVYKVSDLETMPDSIVPGDYYLDLALLSEDRGRALIKLAIEGLRADGWYALSKVKIAD